MHWMVAAIMMLTELVLASTVHAQADHKQVLVLHSTRRDAQFSVVGESELPRMLDAASHETSTTTPSSSTSRGFLTVRTGRGFVISCA